MQAPALDISQWLNTGGEALSLEKLRGRVVVAYAFQMLCPGCVEYCIPQARRVHDLFSPSDVAVIGLHTVFEHHDAMGPEALKAFIHEYKIRFPVGIDRPAEDGMTFPYTMRAYDMQGTPTLLLIDRAGRLQKQMLGHMPDLALGAEIMRLVKEGNAS